VSSNPNVNNKNGKALRYAAIFIYRLAVAWKSRLPWGAAFCPLTILRLFYLEQRKAWHWPH